MSSMRLAKSIKMYLTIFVATTCVYMVLYQYHLSRPPIPEPDLIKSKDISAAATLDAAAAADADVGKIARKYNLFLWSPMLFSAWQQQSPNQDQKLSHKRQQQSINETQSKTTSFTTTQNPSKPKSVDVVMTAGAAAPLSSPLKVTSNVTSSRSASYSTSVHLLSISHSTQQFISRPAAVNYLSQKDAQIASINSTRIIPAAVATTTTTTNTTTTTSSQSPTKQRKGQNLTHSLSATLVNSSANDKSSVSSRATLGKVAKTTNPLLPPLYIITPTYRRAEQLAELTRLGYTLKHVTNLLWLVIEDANQTSPLVIQTLNRIAVPYKYFLAPMPEEYKKTKKAKPRGVSNRNRGLEYIRANATDGVIYFADDDNTYDISIFEQMRYTQKVSMWPVGLVTKFGVSSPIIRHGKITGFYDGWIGGRKFPVDMAGFAVSVKFLHSRPAAKMPFKPGYEEDGFLKSLAPLNLTEIELLASNCTQILTWHTQTKKNPNATKLNMTMYGDTNLVVLDEHLVRA